MHDVTAKPAPAPRGTTRRRFLIGTGAAAGLAIGFAVWPRRQRLNWVAAADEHLINGWVKIGTDGRVIVAVPQAEMGQGVFTALPQILADELGADWNSVGVEPAPLNPIYANRALGHDMADGMPAMLQGFARWGTGELATYFDMQMTGGSSSVRGFAGPLREAGAAAREMLCRAAARDWGADWEDLTTADGFITYKANRARFADFAGKAALEDMPSSPALRDPKTRALMGKSLPRLDVPAKTDGSARFGIDVRIPGMVYAAVRSGPAGDPALAGVDGRAALAVPGVIDVVKGPSWVAVVATGWWQAHTALGQLEPVFARQPRPAGPWIEAALKTALGSDGGEVEKHGDATALLTGDRVVTADYSLPFLAHAALEPMNATARIDGNTIEVWAPVQGLSVATWAVARALGWQDAQVTVHPTLLGGGFGRKIEVDAVVQAALIARAVKRPVQLIWSREEDFAQDKFRPPVAARMRGLATGGTAPVVAAWHARIAVPDIAVSFMPRVLPALASDTAKPSASAVEGAVRLPYAFAASLTEHALVEQPVPLGYWRSVGHSFTAFIVESFVDELAHAANTDSGAFRLALLHDAPRHAAVLRAALAAAGPLGRIEAPAGSRAGRGVALHESFGSIVAQVAEVEAGPGGIRVRRVVCAIDCGPVVNPGIVAAQMEGSIIFGLSAALHGRIGFEDGIATATNFDGYPLLTLAETPAIEVILVDGGGPVGGVGEPGTPPIAPAVANAIFAATGKRLRDLPFAAKA